MGSCGVRWYQRDVDSSGYLQSFLVRCEFGSTYSRKIFGCRISLYSICKIIQDCILNVRQLRRGCNLRISHDNLLDSVRGPAGLTAGGTVIYTYPAIYKVMCIMDVEHFPIDQQICELDVLSSLQRLRLLLAPASDLQLGLQLRQASARGRHSLSPAALQSQHRMVPGGSHHLHSAIQPRGHPGPSVCPSFQSSLDALVCR